MKHAKLGKGRGIDLLVAHHASAEKPMPIKPSTSSGSPRSKPENRCIAKRNEK